jgi:predicted transposase YdaD
MEGRSEGRKEGREEGRERKKPFPTKLTHLTNKRNKTLVCDHGSRNNILEPMNSVPIISEGHWTIC